MRHLHALAAATILAAILGACRPSPETAEDLSSEATDSMSEAVQASMDSTLTAYAGPSGGPGGPGFGDCPGQLTVLTTTTSCGHSYPSSASVAWSCVGPNGNGVNGTAEIATVLSCPATDIQVVQTVDFDRTRTQGDVSGNIAGTSTVSFTATAGGPPALERTIAIDATHKVTEAGVLVRHQEIDGTDTVSLEPNAAGPEDDARVVNGSLAVDFVFAGVQLSVAKTDLTWHRDCCHPISGSFAFTKTGAETGSGSVTFGPACGEAVDDGGAPLNLHACPAVQ